jgi:hypothetical protein
MKVIELWPLDSAGDKTRSQIASLSKWINGVAVTCTSLILLCTILLVFADDRDNGLAFIRSIFDELFTTWSKILFVIFKMTIPLVSFHAVCANVPSDLLGTTPHVSNEIVQAVYHKFVKHFWRR